MRARCLQPFGCTAPEENSGIHIRTKRPIIPYLSVDMAMTAGETNGNSRQEVCDPGPESRAGMRCWFGIYSAAGR
jgi:hypothetical protein